MARRYDGKVVVVTGAAGGLGRALAQGFAAEGAHLVVTDLPGAPLDETAALIADAGGAAEAHGFDVADEAAVAAFGGRLASHHSAVDVLYNNAGMAYGLVSDRTRFDEVTQADWARFFAVNVIAPAVLAKALRPLLKARGGVILNQSSMSSTEPAGPYGVTKAALNAMTRMLAGLYGTDGIRVSAIAPGFMATPANYAALSETLRSSIVAGQMVRREGQPEDIVRLALFLASPEASFITSEVVSCDGGSAVRQWRY